MNKTERRDLNINGVLGGCGGGLFNNVSINGHGAINGDLDCTRFVANGKATVRGSVKAHSIEVNGSSSFAAVETDKLRVNGKSDIEGALTGGNCRIDGHTRVDGPIAVEELEINGSFTAKNNCDAERFRSRGSFRIEGLLNAGAIEIDLYAECRAKEIGGETILVRKTGDNAISKLVKALIFTRDALITDLIEGDEIYIESTKAAVVRGTNISIGPGCDIGLVEYKGEMKRHPDAVIGEVRQV